MARCCSRRFEAMPQFIHLTDERLLKRLAKSGIRARPVGLLSFAIYLAN